MVARVSLMFLVALSTACGPEAKPELYRCDNFNDSNPCSQITGKVCARVDTEIRCIKPPCPSSRLETYSGACEACANDRVDIIYTGSCAGFQRKLDSGEEKTL
jgi:hypothetical protein